MAFLLDRVSGKLIDFFYNLAKLVSRVEAPILLWVVITAILMFVPMDALVHLREDFPTLKAIVGVLALAVMVAAFLTSIAFDLKKAKEKELNCHSGSVEILLPPTLSELFVQGFIELGNGGLATVDRNGKLKITVRLTSDTVKSMKKNEKSMSKLWQDLKNSEGV